MKIEIEACFRSSHNYAILETHSACFLELNMFHIGLLYQSWFTYVQYYLVKIRMKMAGIVTRVR